MPLFIVPYCLIKFSLGAIAVINARFVSAGMVGFNYVIELVPDKKYGALDPDTGEWNGIVRQILEKVGISGNFMRERKMKRRLHRSIWLVL